MLHFLPWPRKALRTQQPRRWAQTHSQGEGQVVGTVLSLREGSTWQQHHGCKGLCPVSTEGFHLRAWVSHFALQNQNQPWHNRRLQNVKCHSEVCSLKFYRMRAKKRYGGRNCVWGCGKSVREEAESWKELWQVGCKCLSSISSQSQFRLQHPHLTIICLSSQFLLILSLLVLQPCTITKVSSWCNLLCFRSHIVLYLPFWGMELQANIEPGIFLAT